LQNLIFHFKNAIGDTIQILKKNTRSPNRTQKIKREKKKVTKKPTKFQLTPDRGELLAFS